MSDNAVVGSTLAITQTVVIFTTLMPAVPEVSQHNDEPEHPFTMNFRRTELVAGSLSLTVAAIMSRLEHNWQPFLMASVLVASLLLAYEYTLRQPGASPNLFNINRNTTEGNTGS